MAVLYNKYQGSESKGQRRGGRERAEAWRNRLPTRPYRKEGNGKSSADGKASFVVLRVGFGLPCENNKIIVE